MLTMEAELGDELALLVPCLQGTGHALDELGLRTGEGQQECTGQQQESNLNHEVEKAELGSRLSSTMTTSTRTKGSKFILHPKFVFFVLALVKNNGSDKKMTEELLLLTTQ